MQWLSTRLYLSALLLIPLAVTTPDKSMGADADPDTQKQMQSSPAAHHQPRRGPKTIALKNVDNAIITFWKPDLTTQVLQAAAGVITLPSTGVNSYHAVVVERNMGDSVETLIRYEYLQGRPSQHSPVELASARKTRFEIVPDPIPREHYHYHSKQTWGFILQFDGQPVANTKVILQTDHGSRVEGVTNQAGRVSLLIPDDFPDIQEGERDERTADFTIRAETVANSINYQTELSADYRINPTHWQSFGWGVTVAGIGFLVGGFIGRTGNRKSKGKN